MIRCEDVQERAADHLCGLLPDWQMEEVAAHAQRCADCGRALEEVKQELRLFDAWEVPELEVDTCPEFMRRLRLHQATELVPWDASLEREPPAPAGVLARVPGLIRRWRALPTGTKIVASSVSLVSVVLLALAITFSASRRSGTAQPEGPPRPLEAPEAEMTLPGLRVRYSEGNVDEALVRGLAEVVSAAKMAIDGLFPDRTVEPIDLLVTRGFPWRESVVTDRRDTIYVCAGNQGIGENMRADAGPVAVMSEAVAQLYNAPRLPGFERFVAHRYLVPAVIDELGPLPIRLPNPTTLAADGVDMLDVITREEYTLVHPDLAAAAALSAIERTLPAEQFRALLNQVQPGLQDPFDALREAVLEVEPALGSAFDAYDQAMRLEPDEEGSCLVASFEPEEAIQAVRDHPLRTIADALTVVVAPDAEWWLTDEDSTHGTHSFQLHLAADSDWMHANLIDPDWQYGDFRRFSRLSLDVRVESPTPQHVAIDIHDEVNCGHGVVEILSAEVEPGGWRRIVKPLNTRTLAGSKDWTAFYFGGAFRAESVCRLQIRVWQPQPPVTLYVDNVRLAPRSPTQRAAPPVTAAGTVFYPGQGAEDIRIEVPVAAHAAFQRGAELKRQGRFREAADALREALTAAPDYVDAHWFLAWVLVELDDEEGAREHFRRVIEIAPGHERAEPAAQALERLGQ